MGMVPPQVEEQASLEKRREGKMLSTIFKVILGLVFLVLGVLATIAWRGALLLVIKGCIGPLLLVAGAITLAIAKE